MRRARLFLVAAAASALASACASSSPSQPTSGGSPAAADATASIAAPRPASPANNAQVRNADQPVTLIAANAITTATTAVTYTFEVASDAAFANKVQTWDNVAQGGGQTTVKLDPLAAGRDYWWHARASGGGTTGVFGAASKFTIGPAISLGTPTPIAPLTGSQTGTRPALRVSNVSRSGPAGAVTYRFEISTSSAFTPLVQVGTNTEGINETGFIPTTDLQADTTFFWRAFAQDIANGVTSTPSAVQSFVTHQPSPAEIMASQIGVPLCPGQVPPGATGHAVLGDNWQVQILHHIPTNTFFASPTIEMIRFFDLFDRGFQPDPAIDWLNTHGYPTIAQWYPPPEKAVLGLQFVYLAARNKITVNGTWDLVLKTE